MKTDLKNILRKRTDKAEFFINYRLFKEFPLKATADFI